MTDARGWHSKRKRSGRSPNLCKTRKLTTQEREKLIKQWSKLPAEVKAEVYNWSFDKFIEKEKNI